jgi:hypothetical protein
MTRMASGSEAVRALLTCLVAAGGCKLGALPEHTELMVEISSNIRVPSEMDVVALNAARADGFPMLDRSEVILRGNGVTCSEG